MGRCATRQVVTLTVAQCRGLLNHGEILLQALGSSSAGVPPTTAEMPGRAFSTSKRSQLPTSDEVSPLAMVSFVCGGAIARCSLPTPPAAHLQVTWPHAGTGGCSEASQAALGTATIFLVCSVHEVAGPAGGLDAAGSATGGTTAREDAPDRDTALLTYRLVLHTDGKLRKAWGLLLDAYVKVIAIATSESVRV